MSKFFMANAIKRNLRAGLLPSLALGFGESMARGLDYAKAFSDAAYFDLEIPAELYWLGSQDDYHLQKDFGPLTPPFPVMWAEWKIPSVPVIHGRPVPDFKFAGHRMSALIESRVSEGRVALSIVQFIEDDSGYPMMIGLPTILALDEEGRYVAGSLAHPYIEEDDRKFPGVKDILSMSFDRNVVYLALNLINCRNVTTHETGQVFPRSGAEKRRKDPIVRYHTIILPGMSKDAGTRKLQRENAAAMAMHRVRGHFKTYTADAPLMGKHVGTYWWGWQVRGNKDNGQVVSDYKIGEMAHA